MNHGIGYTKNKYIPIEILLYKKMNEVVTVRYDITTSSNYVFGPLKRNRRAKNGHRPSISVYQLC